jgi:hypothetical protein
MVVRDFRQVLVKRVARQFGDGVSEAGDVCLSQSRISDSAAHNFEQSNVSIFPMPNRQRLYDAALFAI